MFMTRLKERDSFNRKIFFMFQDSLIVSNNYDDGSFIKIRFLAWILHQFGVAVHNGHFNMFCNIDRNNSCYNFSFHRLQGNFFLLCLLHWKTL